MTYGVILKDHRGSHISDWYEADNLKDAKERANYLLSDEWAIDAETTHEALGTNKVEILNKNGECVWDKFYTARK